MTPLRQYETLAHEFLAVHPAFGAVLILRANPLDDTVTVQVPGAWTYFNLTEWAAMPLDQGRERMVTPAAMSLAQRLDPKDRVPCVPAGYQGYRLERKP